MIDQRKVIKVISKEREYTVRERFYIAEIAGYEPDDRFIIKQQMQMVYSDRDYELTEETRLKYYQRGYAEGYKVGYEWLEHGWNFVHYKESGGYIPGGPVVFNKVDGAVNKGWVAGWKDGIDQYVAEKQYKIGTKSLKRYF